MNLFVCYFPFFFFFSVFAFFFCFLLLLLLARQPFAFNNWIIFNNKFLIWRKTFVRVNIRKRGKTINTVLEFYVFRFKFVHLRNVIKIRREKKKIIINRWVCSNITHLERNHWDLFFLCLFFLIMLYIT